MSPSGRGDPPHLPAVTQLPWLRISLSRGRKALGLSTRCWTRQSKCWSKRANSLLEQKSDSGPHHAHTCLEKRSVSKRQTYKQVFMSFTGRNRRRSAAHGFAGHVHTHSSTLLMTKCVLRIIRSRRKTSSQDDHTLQRFIVYFILQTDGLHNCT